MRSAPVQPLSIKRFGRLFLASVALTILAIMLNYGVLRSQAVAHGSPAASPIIGVVLQLLINFALWFFIVRRASNVAKWILVVLFTIGVISMPWALKETFAVSASYSILNVVAFLLSVVSLAMLFTREAVSWLKSRGAVSTIDPDVFS